MPTYAYACADCGHAFDIVQSFADDSLTVCPECGGRLRKQFNAVGVVFKGSGFYRNDSRPTTAGKGTSDSAPASTGSSDAKDSGAAKGPANPQGTPKGPPSTTPAAASRPSSTGSSGTSASSTG